MAVTVSMPQLGETVTEGTILSWAKQPGDSIAEDEVLLEISTDKVDTEVPSPAAGIIQQILVAEGETVTVGTPLAVIAEPGEDAGLPAEDAPATDAEAADVPTDEEPSEAGETVAEEPVAEAQDEPAEAPVADAPAADTEPAAAAAGVAAAGLAPTQDAPRRGVLSPVVRKLAGEHGIDLAQVAGSGDGGRITRSDVMAFIDAGAIAKVAVEPAAPPAPAAAEEIHAESAPAAAAVAAAVPPAPPAAPAAPAAPPPTPAPAPAPTPAAAPAPAPAPAAPPAPAPVPAVPPAAAASAAMPGEDVVDIGRLRKRIADNMVMAKRTAAHVWTSVEVDYSNVERARTAHKEAFKAQHGFSFTYLPFISRATIDALHAFPVVNSAFHLEEGTQVFHSNVNMGIAVDMNQGGLVVVTLNDADAMSIVGLAKGIREKALKARDGKLEPDDVSGSTFTITNPGPYGSFMSAPIINVPNAAILSTDTVAKRATVISMPDGTDAIGIRPVGYLGLTWDHRVFDGSTAVLFLQRIKHNLESWDWEQELS